MSNLITVVATHDDRHVILFETDKEHPKGEAFLYNDVGVETEVAKTPAVMSLLRDGSLRQVDGPTPKKTAAQKKAEKAALEAEEEHTRQIEEAAANEADPDGDE